MLRIASDIGGTFTDLVYLDDKTGAVGVAKASSTPTDYAAGVVHTVQKASLDLSVADFFVHGSTIIINALTERKGVKTALITTHGFRDVLEIGRANRPDIYNLYYTKPAPFVTRHLRLEVRERTNYKGEELEPLNGADVRSAAEQCKQEGVQAIAVAFIHAYANPSHEMECGDLLNQWLPDIPITLSHQITKEWREYERTNTAVLNAYVHPIAQSYLNHLEQSLSALHMKPVGHVMQSNGGSATFASAARLPIYTVESGPVAGVIGAAAIGQLLNEPNVISLDIGGTTAKTSLIEGGEPKITTDYRIEYRRDYAGYPIHVPTVDIVEIGAGGGSIAWLDKAGALHVGPLSAGAEPGPACYGRGGTQPTVTDAHVIAGRINPHFFLGGEVPLDVGQARDALKPIAAQFGVGVDAAAMGVIRLANDNMVNALKLVSVRRGHDPRDFVLVAFGGGGAMHAATLGRELRVNEVIIPTHPAVFSAWGMLMADLRKDYIRTMVVRTDKVDPALLDRMYTQMEVQALDEMRHEHIKQSRMHFVRRADLRYVGQEHTVKVPVPAGSITAKQVVAINDRFHKLHEHMYTFRLDSAIELVNFHLTVLGTFKKPRVPKIGQKGSLRQALKGKRRVNFDEYGVQQCPIYERAPLPAGAQVKGPAVIEEPTATTVVFPDQRLRVDEYGFLHIEI